MLIFVALFSLKLFTDEAMCQNLAQLTVTMSRLSTSTSATCGVYCQRPEDHQVSKLGRQYCLSEDRDKSVIYVYVCDSKPCRNLDNFVMSMPGKITSW